MNSYIAFDARDLERCRAATLRLWGEIVRHHGPAVAQRLFAEFTSRQMTRELNNDWLLIEYIKSGLSVKKFAAWFAEKNKSLFTNAEALEKQIRRQKKLMDRQPGRRARMEKIIKHFRPDIS